MRDKRESQLQFEKIRDIADRFVAERYISDGFYLHFHRNTELYCQLKIECQNVNVPAVDFYFSREPVLGAVNRYAYYAEPSLRDEVQFLLYLDLDGGRNEIRCAKQGDVL